MNEWIKNNKNSNPSYHKHCRCTYLNVCQFCTADTKILAVHILTLSFDYGQLVLLSIRFVSVFRLCNFSSQWSIRHINLPPYQSLKAITMFTHNQILLQKKKKSCNNLQQTILEATFSVLLRAAQGKKCWVSKIALVRTWPMLDEKLSGSFALISSGVNPVKSFPAESVIKETCFPLKESFQAQGLWDSPVIITLMFPLCFLLLLSCGKCAGAATCGKRKIMCLEKKNQKRRGKRKSLSVRRVFFFFFFSLPGCDLSDIRCQVEQRNRNSPC